MGKSGGGVEDLIGSVLGCKDHPREEGGCVCLSTNDPPREVNGNFSSATTDVTSPYADNGEFDDDRTPLIISSIMPHTTI